MAFEAILKEVVKNALPYLTEGMIKAILDSIGKTFLIVKKGAPVVYKGEQGFLIWDYLLFNEITFVSSSTQNYISLFTSMDDNATENEFNRLLGLSKET